MYIRLRPCEKTTLSKMPFIPLRNICLLVITMYIHEHSYLTCFIIVCVYDLFFVIYHVLNNFMKFVTYMFDLIAYCNLAFFHDEFNIQSDLCG
jgi:hypothetical protein